MTSQEQQNIELARNYEDTYSNDIERFVFDCYASDCEVTGGLARGHEQVIRVERHVHGVAAMRRMRVDRTHATDNLVIVEAALLDADQDADWNLPLCAVPTCQDGKIATDGTYAGFAKWPGL